MAAKIAQIADAVVTELKAGKFSQALTAERKYQPTDDLNALQELHVTVVPKSRASALASRGDDRVEYAVDIGIQKKAGGEAEVDELIELVDEIARFLNRRPLTAVPDVSWVQTVNEPIFFPDHLAEQRLFTSVLTVTYRTVE